MKKVLIIFSVCILMYGVNNTSALGASMKYPGVWVYHQASKEACESYVGGLKGALGGVAGTGAWLWNTHATISLITLAAIAGRIDAEGCECMADPVDGGFRLFCTKPSSYALPMQPSEKHCGTEISGGCQRSN